MNFYIYGWFTSNNVCFYIGKGKGKRAYDLRARNAKFNDIISKDAKCKVQFLAENLSEEESFRLEREFISKLNPEANLTSGGQGNSGYKYTEEQRRKLKERMNSPEVKARHFRPQEYERTPEIRKKISESIRKRIVTRWPGYPNWPPKQET